MRIDFCCREMGRALLWDTMVESSDGIFVNGDEVKFCPFCGKDVKTISTEYLHEGY